MIQLTLQIQCERFLNLKEFEEILIWEVKSRGMGAVKKEIKSRIVQAKMELNSKQKLCSSISLENRKMFLKTSRSKDTKPGR